MATTPPCSVADCHLDVDLIFESSDGKHFGVHSTNLESFSAGFPPANPAANDPGQPIEVVKMGEFSGDSLPLFLQFMHHTEQPEIHKLPFPVLLQIAEGAEKYCVYSAKQVCRAVIKDCTRFAGNDAEILTYFARHGYLEEANETALLAIMNRDKRTRNNITGILSYSMHTNIYHAWKEYYNKHKEAARAASEESEPVLHKGGITECSKWAEFAKLIRSWQNDDPIANVPNSAQFIDKCIRHFDDCKWCTRRAQIWGSKCMWWDPQMADFKFTDFLR